MLLRPVISPSVEAASSIDPFLGVLDSTKARHRSSLRACANAALSPGDHVLRTAATARFSRSLTPRLGGGRSSALRSGIDAGGLGLTAAPEGRSFGSASQRWN